MLAIETIEGIAACPDCRGRLEALGPAEGPVLLACDRCKHVYPFVDDIPILLGVDARNSDLEEPLIASAVAQLGSVERERLRPLVDATLSLLHAARGQESWEWEDEAFWGAEYTEALQQGREKDWNDRLLERQPLVDDLLADLHSLDGKVIVDIGAGEAQTFAYLLAPHCPATTVYVAIDISLAALRLNRSRNPHTNSLYILGSAANLPILPKSADVLCYWGILHHTKGKEESIAQDADLLRDGGYVMMFEALARPTFTELARRTPVEMSAHEERIDRDRLFAAIESVDAYHVLYQREFCSAFYSWSMHGKRGDALASTERRFHALAAVDRAIIRWMSFVPLFRPAAVLLLLRHGDRAGASVPA